MIKSLIHKFGVLNYFAKGIWIYSIPISLIIWSQIGFATGLEFYKLLQFIFYIKLGTNFFIGLLFEILRSKNIFIFYNNVGLNKTWLWAYTYILDTVFFGLIIWSYSLLK